jgi:hypothetical protein
VWKGGGRVAEAGAWEEVSISYRDHTNHYCDCCGKHVPRYLYVATVGGARRRFCSPDCADVYDWYWLPRYGASGEQPRR